VFRLRDKGIIAPLDKYGVGQYVPLVSEEEYVQSEVPTFVDRVFEGSVKRLVVALVDSGELSVSDIDELREYFKVKEGDS
jgi:BlaI family penicillinase repressor